MRVLSVREGTSPERRRPALHATGAATQRASHTAVLDALDLVQARDLTETGQPEKIGCTSRITGYVVEVDWQQLTSLLIVGLAGGTLVAGRLRRPRLRFQRDL